MPLQVGALGAAVGAVERVVGLLQAWSHVGIEIERTAAAEVARAGRVIREDAGDEEGDTRVHDLHGYRYRVLIEHVACAGADVFNGMEGNVRTVVGEDR